MEVATRKSQPLIHTAPPAEPVERKLTIEKFADGPFTCLKFVGTIDESFDGKKIGKTVEAEWLVLDLGGVKKISSFGIRQWVDFIATIGPRLAGIYFVECAPKVVDQFNMVANFGGAGHLVSFYAPYRCDYCSLIHFSMAPYSVRRLSTWSRYSDAKFAFVAVRRSPPEPFTHSTRVASPVSGSFTVILEDVLPPPVFVMRASAPRMFER